jgi:hypothetical protein
MRLLFVVMLISVSLPFAFMSGEGVALEVLDRETVRKTEIKKQIKTNRLLDFIF